MKTEVHQSSDAIVPDRTVSARGARARREWAGRRIWPLVAAMFVLAVRADTRGTQQAREGSPPAGTQKPAPRGALVICGGGGMPDSVTDEFVRLAGGPKARIVVIPTASGYADGPAADLAGFLEPWTRRGVASAVLLHTRSRARADEPAFTRPLEEATGVWFSGGDQSRVTEAYLGTAVERALGAVLERDGVLGGTSAGAAIMSRVMITGGQDRATVGTGFGFLPGAVVDQHALRRSRINRLLGVLADHPDLVGVAVDESTALVVRQGRWQVMGRSYVLACRSPGRGQPVQIDVFHDGDRGSLDDWKPRPPRPDRSGDDHVGAPRHRIVAVRRGETPRTTIRTPFGAGLRHRRGRAVRRGSPDLAAARTVGLPARRYGSVRDGPFGSRPGSTARRVLSEHRAVTRDDVRSTGHTGRPHPRRLSGTPRRIPTD
jgi:cyanophycinase